MFDQVAAALVDRPRTLRKVHPTLGDIKIISSAASDNGQAVSGDATGQLEYELFDDREFYHHQLKEFLESRGEGTGAADALALARRRRSKRTGVDPRASKGRKLRYDVHPKVRNDLALRTESTRNNPPNWY